MGDSCRRDDKCIVGQDKVLEAVRALIAYIQKRQEKSGKKQLLVECEKIWLQLTLKKIPELKRKAVKLYLPHSLTSESASVCLFVKDLDRNDREYEKSVHHFKEYLQSKGVKVTPDIIPLKSLRLEYKPYEAKRNLSNMYDIYLADARIVRFLPPILGKNFYNRNRDPIQVDLTAKDLKKEIHNAINRGRCVVSGKGSVSNCFIATTGMKEIEIAENVHKAAEQLAKCIPGGLENIRSFHIKTTNSLAIPLYVCLGSANKIKLPVAEKEEEEMEPEEISTLLDAKVIISKDGNVRVVSSTYRPPKRHKKKNVKTGDIKKKSEKGKAKMKVEKGKGKKDMKHDRAKKNINRVRAKRIQKQKKLGGKLKTIKAK